MKPTQRQIEAAETVFLAMAHTQTIRPTIESIKQDVLNEFKFKYDQKWIDRIEDLPAYIMDFKNDYEMSNEDFKVYYNECFKRYVAAGFNVKFEYCPLLIAESLERDAKHELIKEMEPVTNISLEMATRSLSSYKKLVELSLRFIAPFVSSKNILSSL